MSDLKSNICASSFDREIRIWVLVALLSVDAQVMMDLSKEDHPRHPQ